MPCDTPPPPPPLDESSDFEEDPEEMMYEFVDELEIIDAGNDDSVVTFAGHKDSVFCCNFDPNGRFVVTGGQDDTAYVWERETGVRLFECSGHAESVIAASFSPDGEYVATADMNGLIQVREVVVGNLEWSFECAEVNWMEWLHNQNVLIAGTTDGTCWWWNIPEGDTGMFASSGCSCTCGCVSPNDENVAVGYSDGTLKVWNIKNETLVGSVTSATGHKSSITTIKYHPDSSLILTGSEDGTAKLTKTSNYKVIWSVNCCEAQHGHENVCVESVDFCPSQSLIILGSNCGQLSFWDFSTQTKRFSCSLDSFYEAAIVKIICNESSLLVYVCTAEGMIQAFDVRTGTLKHSWDGHHGAILDLQLSQDGEFLLTSSDDSTCKMFTQPKT